MDCYTTAFGLNALNFNDYFEYCRSKNFRANHPYSASGRLRKKKPNFVGFDRFDRFVEKFGGNFAENFRANSAIKQSVNNRPGNG